ncbi:MAG TPA: sporulation protein [Bacillus bacterium]|nr:sporulation protein [Bacillus sp. (in: firmicutes)]
MFKIKKSGLLASIMALSTVLAGCAIGGEQAIRQMDTQKPQEVTYVEEDALDQKNSSAEQVENQEENEAEQTVSRELYLLDKNGFVVPQTLPLPKTNEVAKQALEYLVEGGPISELLPNGFRAILPAGTMVNGVNLQKDGTLVVDFSKEFSNYNAEDELKILQALTYTLTQFDTVNKVKIQINGYDQTNMPVNGTPINEGTSRANGINFDNGEVVDVVNSKAVTLYFLGQNGDNTYFVPVTRRIGKNDDAYEATVKELIKGPNVVSGLYTELHKDIALLEKPSYKGGVLTLNFNEGILSSLQGTALSKNILNELVLSLTEHAGVDGVAIKVNGMEKVLNEQGAEIAAPVLRPKSVNTGSF